MFRDGCVLQGYGLAAVNLFAPPTDSHVSTDLRSVIAALGKWLGNVYATAPPPPSRVGVLRFLLSLACTTGDEMRCFDL
jgi:hypothetical protein